MKTIVMFGAGKELCVLYSGMTFGLCDLLWFHLELNSPTVWFDNLTDFNIVFFFFCMHFNQSQIQPTSPSSSLGKAILVCGAFFFNTIWLGEWTGTILLSKANSSDNTSPKPICSGFGWWILKLDPGRPAFWINIIIRHMNFAMCSAKHLIGNKQQILETP